MSRTPNDILGIDDTANAQAIDKAFATQAWKIEKANRNNLAVAKDAWLELVAAYQAKSGVAAGVFPTYALAKLNNQIHVACQVEEHELVLSLIGYNTDKKVKSDVQTGGLIDNSWTPGLAMTIHQLPEDVSAQNAFLSQLLRAQEAAVNAKKALPRPTLATGVQWDKSVQAAFDKSFPKWTAIFTKPLFATASLSKKLASNFMTVLWQEKWKLAASLALAAAVGALSGGFLAVPALATFVGAAGVSVGHSRIKKAYESSSFDAVPKVGKSQLRQTLELSAYRHGYSYQNSKGFLPTCKAWVNPVSHVLNAVDPIHTGMGEGAAKRRAAL